MTVLTRLARLLPVLARLLSVPRLLPVPRLLAGLAVLTRLTWLARLAVLTRLPRLTVLAWLLLIAPRLAWLLVRIRLLPVVTRALRRVLRPVRVVRVVAWRRRSAHHGPFGER